MTLSEKLTTIAENQPKIYAAGFAAGAAGGVPMITGAATTSSRGGVLSIPRPSFEPRLIVVWNVERQDNGDDVPYLYSGVLLVAKYIDGEWVSQGMSTTSDGVYIANASATSGFGYDFPDKPGTCVDVRSDAIYYQIPISGQFDAEFNGETDISAFENITVNYAVYG